MPTCAIYARVSDESQVRGESIDHQISFCREIARRRSLETADTWSTPEELVYVDKGVTGTSLVKREAVRRLIFDAKQRRFDVVLFKGISRFARDTVDALIMLRTLLACDVRVVSMEENFDSARDSAEFVFTIHSALAQAESEKTAIRVRMGAVQKARAGKWNGKPPDGYLLNRVTKHLEIDEPYAPTIRKIFALYVEGYGARKITELLNNAGLLTKRGCLWSQRSVTRILTNPVYAGDVVYGRREHKTAPPPEGDPLARRKVTKWVADPGQIVVARDAHPALVDRQSFALVEHIMKTRRAVRGRSGQLHLMSAGFIQCGCGGHMSIKYNSHGTRYYRCTRQAEKGRIHCTQPFLRADDVERVVLASVFRQTRARVHFGPTQNLFDSLFSPSTPSVGVTRQLLERLVHHVSADGYKLEIWYRFNHP